MMFLGCNRFSFRTLVRLLLAAGVFAAQAVTAAPETGTAARTFSFHLDAQGRLGLESARTVQRGHFAPGTNWQTIAFTTPVSGRFFCLEALSSADGRPFAAAAELELLDAAGQPLPREKWQLAYADSEETDREYDWAENAFDGQPETYWHTQWSKSPPNFPHRLIVDLGDAATLTGFRYLPRQGDPMAGGRIEDFEVFVADTFIRESRQKSLLPEKIFLFSHFTDFGADGLHLAWSRDGYNWESLYRGRSFLAPGLGGTN